jgi:hypothetical protein
LRESEKSEHDEEKFESRPRQIRGNRQKAASIKAIEAGEREGQQEET